MDAEQLRHEYEAVQELYRKKSNAELALKNNRAYNELRRLRAEVDAAIASAESEVESLETAYDFAVESLKLEASAYYMINGINDVEGVTVRQYKNQVRLSPDKEKVKQLVDFLRWNGRMDLIRVKHELDKRAFDKVAQEIIAEIPNQDWFAVADEYRVEIKDMGVA